MLLRVINFCISHIQVRSRASLNMGKGQQKQRASAVEEVAGQSQKKVVRPQVIHGDLYQRANFTFQASAFLQQLQSQDIRVASILHDQSSAQGQDEKKVKDGKREEPDLSRLSRNIMAASGKMVVHNQMKL